MVDLGFLNKFEEYYGRRMTKALVGLVAGGAVVVILGGTWTYVRPVVTWATTEGESWTVVAFRAFSFVISFGAVFSLGNLVSQAVAGRAKEQQFIADVEMVADRLTSFADSMKDAVDIQQETMGIYQESVAILDRLKDREAAASLRDTIKKSKANSARMARLSDQAREMSAELEAKTGIKRHATREPLTIENVAPHGQPSAAKSGRK
ncbi:hypothetical protein EN866_19370 [Mesorhizobium sp. M2D.F.Ca.ET.223.01.1.1]|uniref:hypothetical protein n=1 Tax=unclassified Mesorhizobium TaxID=325217 RepID=UPI000FC9A1BD|nr:MULTISPECIES: hypothetical protein [unclassified Mesorhizobium]TGP89321.1 hypothetical protein EN864_19380 [bacterium M00.F.Ca.ET.221.01.1.1]TGP94694.1 hypothetical protein EN865_15250 [bacterium M00.F.Ca.ET.222.01.1.1]RVD58892.1 hypothetical protein EN783_14745 [Mesorhizobium sp. M2D.F.Ca.ET.140.01.1.1]TGP27921.1 hypothetical protein EN875_033230 [Mesorhizobium sp. M2D.F.Ca.ET.232.01.1.1]TGP75862.1 hypothetical protein EN867_15250 [Mesorhizobium sp. M2D.F.Ca.ET.224.01.1.1]